MIFRFGELFCGPGGLALGAKQARVTINNELFAVEHIWANDIDNDACKTYQHNILSNNDGLVINCDVKELDIRSLPAIDAFAYGFPCNDFSQVGEQNGVNGNYGGLYKYGIEVLQIHNPKWFFAENVSGLENADDGNAFIKILNELKNAGKGYVLTPHLYKFEQYGVPQLRHRIIIVGIRKDLGLEFKVPSPTHKDPDTWISAKTALENPPIPLDAFNNEQTNHASVVVERLKHIPPGKNAWFAEIPEHLRLNVKKAKLSQIYRRLHPDLPSYTITGSGGGGTHGYHWKEPRALTNRERARLQTFPDDFIFIGKKESVRKQIGMAVPPLGAKIIIRAIFYTFAGINYDYVPAKWESFEYQESLL